MFRNFVHQFALNWQLSDSVDWLFLENFNWVKFLQITLFVTNCCRFTICNHNHNNHAVTRCSFIYLKLIWMISLFLDAERSMFNVRNNNVKSHFNGIHAYSKVGMDVQTLAGTICSTNCSDAHSYCIWIRKLHVLHFH